MGIIDVTTDKIKSNIRLMGLRVPVEIKNAIKAIFFEVDDSIHYVNSIKSKRFHVFIVIKFLSTIVVKEKKTKLVVICKIFNSFYSMVKNLLKGLQNFIIVDEKKRHKLPKPILMSMYVVPTFDSGKKSESKKSINYIFNKIYQVLSSLRLFLSFVDASKKLGIKKIHFSEEGFLPSVIPKLANKGCLLLGYLMNKAHSLGMKNKKWIGVFMVLTTMLLSLNSIKKRSNINIDELVLKDESMYRMKDILILKKETGNKFENSKLISNGFVLISKLASIFTPNFIKDLISYRNILNMIYVVSCSSYIRRLENKANKNYQDNCSIVH